MYVQYTHICIHIYIIYIYIYIYVYVYVYPYVYVYVQCDCPTMWLSLIRTKLPAREEQVAFFSASILARKLSFPSHFEMHKYWRNNYTTDGPRAQIMSQVYIKLLQEGNYMYVYNKYASPFAPTQPLAQTPTQRSGWRRRGERRQRRCVRERERREERREREKREREHREKRGRERTQREERERRERDEREERQERQEKEHVR